jgi:hypothetical protein
MPSDSLRSCVVSQVSVGIAGRGHSLLCDGNLPEQRCARFYASNHGSSFSFDEREIPGVISDINGSSVCEWMTFS